MTSPDPIASAYDDWSVVYDADVNATLDLNAEVLRAELLDIDQKDVLEIGRGMGLNTVWIAESARSAVAAHWAIDGAERSRAPSRRDSDATH